MQEVADRVRAIGVLVAVFLVCHALYDDDPIPVGPQFIGNHRGQARSNALPHFDPVGDDPDRAVGLEAEIHVRRPGFGRLLRCLFHGDSRRVVAPPATRQRDPQHQQAAGLHEFPARHFANVFHVPRSMPCSAAVRMALRIRW